MAYAIIQLGSKQLKVSEGDIFEIERQKKINIDVLAYSDGKVFEFGTPILTGINVETSVLDERLDKKVMVARYKSKSRYRKRKGHRQPITVIKVESISKGAKKASAKKVTTKSAATKTATKARTKKPTVKKTAKKVTKSKKVTA